MEGWIVILNQYFNSLTYEVIEMLKGMHFYPVLSSLLDSYMPKLYFAYDISSENVAIHYPVL